jgi:GPN-loop GTPase
MSNVFGQIIIGPPGSGKTKYCSIMQSFLTGLGRQVVVINLDPANDNLVYDCQINIFDLINIEDVMKNFNLGPNGSLLYCIEFLEQNIDWLIDEIEICINNCNNQNKENSSLSALYLLFDLPGQVELYTHHKSIRNIIQYLVTKLDYRLCCVNLVDSYYTSDASKFISVMMMSLSSMIQIELPHVNVLSKMDLIKQYGDLSFNLDYYTDVLDLHYLVDTLKNDKFFQKFKKYLLFLLY